MKNCMKGWPGSNHSSKMKIFFILLLLSLSFTTCYSQENFTMNLGGTSQRNYFTEIEYEQIRWLPIIRVTINGKGYRFLVDTGAPNGITQTLFNELKPDVIKKVPMLDSNNDTDSLNIVSLKEITLGTVTFNNVPTVVLKNTLIYDCLKVDGSVGSNMLRNSIVHFSSKTSEMVITDQPERLNLNNKQPTDLFLTNYQSTPFFNIKFFGMGSASIPTFFDTGFAGYFDLALDHFKAAEQAEIFNVQATSRGKVNLGLYGFESDTTQYRLQVPEININSAIFKNVNLKTAQGKDSMIGARLLDYGIVTVDYKNRKFYFDPFEKSFDLTEELFPVSLIPKDNKLWVEMIWDEELKQVISVNDQVLAIDEVDYSNVSICHIMKSTTLFGDKGQAVLTLKNSDGVIRNVTVNKK